MCEHHRDNIDIDMVACLVKDVAVKRNCEDYLNILKPISISLDRMQAANCSLADSVSIWKELADLLKPILSTSDYKSKLIKRMNSNLTPNHYLAYLLTPKYAGTRLDHTELDNVFEYLADNHPLYLATVMDFNVQKGVFAPYRFKSLVVDNVCIMSWWETIHVGLNFINFVKQLISAVNSSAVSSGSSQLSVWFTLNCKTDWELRRSASWYSFTV